jgi:putative ABC transport system permease protein
MFSVEFVLLALLANLAGAPLFVWLGKIWLNDFVYKTSIGVSIIIITVLTSIAVALLTVSAVTWRAATSNPADSLRHQ